MRKDPDYDSYEIDDDDIIYDEEENYDEEEYYDEEDNYDDNEDIIEEEVYEEAYNESEYDDDDVYYIDNDEDEDVDEVYYTTDASYEDLSKRNKKIIIISIAIILTLIASYFLYKKIEYDRRPDAIMTTKDINIYISVDGYNGYAKAVANYDGDAEIIEAKDMSKADLIRQDITLSDISFDKSSKLKNGDVIKATMKISSPNYRVEFDNDTIEKEFKVSELKNVINSYSDLNKEFLDKLSDAAAESFDDQSYYLKDSSVTIMGVFEKSMSEAEVKDYANGNGENTYSILIFARVNYKRFEYYDYYYDENYYTNETSYITFIADDFYYSGDEILASFNSGPSYDDETEKTILDEISSDGYKRVNKN